MNRFTVCVALTISCFIGEGHSWSYPGDNWDTEFPDYCDGDSQSPINFNRFETEYGLFWPPLTFNNYDVAPSSVGVLNNGHSVVVYMEEDSDPMPSIEGAFLAGPYCFAQYHFHWGSENGQGSEHTIDTVQYPMELHFVHYKCEYGSLSAAVSEDDGLAVLGVLFHISDHDNPALAPLVSQLSDVMYFGNLTSSDDFYAFASLLPEDTKRFFRYQGSLTTPTCNEIVTWTVFNDAIDVSNAQMEAFRGLLDDHDHDMSNNFRATQPINGRQVRRSFF